MKFFALLAGLVTLFKTFAAAPLALHPDNPHYFLFRGQATMIITSGEHYGAVVNLDFNYVAYLNELAARQLNGTRTFTGAYVEPMGAFGIVDNTLAPAAGRFIAPWMRTATPGYAGGGNKFDLNKWNDTYFGRLRDFVRQAGTRGVIVEVVLFCPFYEDSQWKLSPLNASNNVNGLGTVARTNVYTLDKHGGLLDVQEKLTRKIVTELNQFDNVYYEICNEPYFGGVTKEWQHRIADVIVDTESKLPNKHLISQNVANGSALIEAPHPNISIFNFHYAAPPDAVALNYDLNKVIGDNETGFRGTNNLVYRREAWEFILAGGALFNHLDYSFTARHPAGTFVNYPATQPGGGNSAFREELRVLRNFVQKFDFIRMKPDTNVIAGGVPAGMTARALAQEDKAWAIYVGPAPTGVDRFSVRWTGKIRIDREGDYFFHTMSNDGVRLWVADELVIDNWTPHAAKEDTGKVTLRRGQHNVKLEYFQNGGNAVMRLGWTPPGGKKAIVPGAVLGGGLAGEYFLGENFETSKFNRVDATIQFDWSQRSPFEGGAAALQPGKAMQLELALPRGEFEAQWVNTRTGRVDKRQRIEHRSGKRKLEAPVFQDDIALDLRRVVTGSRR